MADLDSGKPEWRRVLVKLGPCLGLLAVWVFFTVLRPLVLDEPFSTWGTLREVLRQSTIVGIAALGAMLIIISGGIDLSVGAVLALTTMVIGGVSEWTLANGMPPVLAGCLAAGAGIATGAACGVTVGSAVIGHLGRVVAVAVGVLCAVVLLPAHIGQPLAVLAGVAVAAALWVANRVSLGKLELSPFIVTLGMMGVFRGLAKGVLEQTTISPPHTWVNALMQFGDSGPTRCLPWGTWLFILLAVVVALTLRYTAFGRHVFAIGSNEETARLCGVNVPRTKLTIYVIAIALAGVAGIMQFSYINMGSATEGMGFELAVIAAVVIGGASLAGGEGSVLGTIVGALLMRVVITGCSKMEWPSFMQEVVTGAIIVAAVALDRLRHRRPE
ncbi:MAG: ABC transporter permease [Lentisphaerae bacterium]|jgi:ribose transport system permease protein|nr:ABC transporter permease [Lentisphaerota bacterium]MBT5611023.1 ABC transporter permease [Lentisphaerota bacterium]MBT7059344.1 ABC transporter permease [Lentisphaerota bacterium]MBT7845993.1 ABC transporter permease [Lentisphaerota bacterium]